MLRKQLGFCILLPTNALQPAKKRAPPAGLPDGDGTRLEAHKTDNLGKIDDIVHGEATFVHLCECGIVDKRRVAGKLAGKLGYLG